MDVATVEAGGGNMGLATLADSGAAGDAWDEVGFAAGADSSSEVLGEVDAGPHGDLAGEVNMALG